MKYILIILIGLVGCNPPETKYDKELEAVKKEVDSARERLKTKPKQIESTKYERGLIVQIPDSVRYFMIVYVGESGTGNMGWSQVGFPRMKDLKKSAAKEIGSNVAITNIIELRNKSDYNQLWKGYKGFKH